MSLESRKSIIGVELKLERVHTTIELPLKRRSSAIAMCTNDLLSDEIKKAGMRELQDIQKQLAKEEAQHKVRLLELAKERENVGRKMKKKPVLQVTSHITVPHLLEKVTWRQQGCMRMKERRWKALRHVTKNIHMHQTFRTLMFRTCISSSTRVLPLFRRRIVLTNGKALITVEAVLLTPCYP